MIYVNHDDTPLPVDEAWQLALALCSAVFFVWGTEADAAPEALTTALLQATVTL